MELRHYLSLLKRRALLIVLTVIAGLVAGYVSTPQEARYVAFSTIYVGAREFTVGPDGRTSEDALRAVERLANTYTQMIHSEPIAQAALQRIGIDRSAGSLVTATNVFPVKDTQLLRIEVTDPNPAMAQELTNAVARAFVEKVQTFEPSTPATEGSVPSLPAYVFEEAKLPTTALPTGLARNLVLYAVFGFVLAAGTSLLLEYLDLTIKTPSEAERRLELPVLGVIPAGLEHPGGSLSRGPRLIRSA
jgi:capsular polysaccharide biosynthesis protein